MFGAGIATFGLLYCVQPLMPQFSRLYGVSAAGSALSLSLPSGVMAVAVLFAGAVSDAWGRKAIMSASTAIVRCVDAARRDRADLARLLALRTLLGLTLSGLPAAAMAYLSEEMHAGLRRPRHGPLHRRRRGRRNGRAPADRRHWPISMAGASPMAAMGAIGLTACLAVHPQTFRRRATSWRNRGTGATLLSRFAGIFTRSGLPWLFAEGFVLLGAFVTVYNYISYRLMAPPYGSSQAAVGFIFSVYPVGMLSSTWMGHLAGRLGRRKVLWAMFVIMLAGPAVDHGRLPVAHRRRHRGDSPSAFSAAIRS